jgi:hypothetical protein
VKSWKEKIMEAGILILRMNASLSREGLGIEIKGYNKKVNKLEDSTKQSAVHPDGIQKEQVRHLREYFFGAALAGILEHLR